MKKRNEVEAKWKKEICTTQRLPTRAVQRRPTFSLVFFKIKLLASISNQNSVQEQRIE
ncbi:hypothetical protein LOK49_LG12G02037 [Camellia lanceoleosa]|uniref:Uncharacterized protein n=1 Tax=Camellia lanceoleosa TaxID=1840588 RepID=A0ACC0FRI8_9ERIC|nr:hypothetical protein LOK49_LG12G02037 [Camellia lanceoleosa]